MESHTKHPAIQVIVNEMSNVVNDKEYLHKGVRYKVSGRTGRDEECRKNMQRQMKKGVLDMLDPAAAYGGE